MTTREQALTVDCPECGKPAGEMCVTKTQTYVPGTGYGRGHGDKAQIGREAKHTHNGRNVAYFWANLPYPIEVDAPEWDVAPGPFLLLSDYRYRIEATLIDRPERVWKYEAQRREGEVWVSLGSVFGQYQRGQGAARQWTKALCEADRRVLR